MNQCNQRHLLQKIYNQNDTLVSWACKRKYVFEMVGVLYIQFEVVLGQMHISQENLVPLCVGDGYFGMCK